MCGSGSGAFCAAAEEGKVKGFLRVRGSETGNQTGGEAEAVVKVPKGGGACIACGGRGGVVLRPLLQRQRQKPKKQAETETPSLPETKDAKACSSCAAARVSCPPPAPAPAPAVPPLHPQHPHPPPPSSKPAPSPSATH